MSLPFQTFLWLLAFPFITMAQPSPALTWQWNELPELPSAVDESAQAGLAGAFSGISQDALIIAGGANFPALPPWEGGIKVYWDDIYVLEKNINGDFQWHVIKDVKLPNPLAYGVAITTDEGLLCIGGARETLFSDQVFLLQWDKIAKRITIKNLPPLPVPMAFMAGARIGNHVYVAGGQERPDGPATKNFYRLNLQDYRWNALKPWPGTGRILPIAVAQSDGNTDCFFLFSGRKPVAGSKTSILSDAYRYHPLQDKWSEINPVSTGELVSLPVVGSAGIASGINHILIFGGDDGELFRHLEDLDRQIDTEDTVARHQAVKQKLKTLLQHPGFSRNILAYHTITDTWHMVGELPFESQVTTQAIRWHGDIVIPTGEIKPGTRTHKVHSLRVIAEPVFGWINYSVIGIYLLVLVGMGFYFSRYENTTHDYFKAGGRIPWWAAGLSIFGTQLSAITFMAIPAKTYATDWAYFMLNMTIIILAPIIVHVFLPFYRRLNITTAYTYLEMRFNLAARLIGSLMFVVFQFGRIGIVLFLPSIALSLVTGIEVTTCILVMGVLSIIYTVLGGIEAVVWTDVVQVIVLLGGALLCLLLIPYQLDGGWSAMLHTAIADQKFHLFNFRFDWATATFWVVLLGGMGSNLISYGSDQVVVQRYLTTKDERSAAKSIWIGAMLTIPATLIFFGLGTALYVFYKKQPGLLDVTLENSDAIFPHFIVAQLPQGVAGLLIAGIFAAAMSSLDSSMNAVASVITTDFYQRFKPSSKERFRLKIARWATAVVGISGTIFALFMATWDIQSLWDQLNTFIGLFAGGLSGVFLLGICTRKANGTGAVTGLVVSGLVQLVVKEYTFVHFLLYTVTGMLACFVVGYITSLFTGGSTKDIHSLTIYTIHSKNNHSRKKDLSV